MKSSANTAKRYENIKLILSLTETTVSLILLIGFIFGGYSIAFRDWSGQWTAHPYLQLLIFIGASGAVFSLISFPFSFIGGFWLEHHFKLSNQSILAWIWEKLKGLFIGLILFTPVLIVFYFFLRNFPDTWWLWTASLLFLFSVVIGRIAPQLIFPLFYKFERIDDESLITRMQQLAEKGKFALEGVYRFNMSKTTKKANAAFTGLGKSRRIIIGDTLLDRFELDEIESVFAHEVGHYVHKHLFTGVVVGTVSSFLSLFVADLVYSSTVTELGFSGVADLAALPLISLILSIFALIKGPLTNTLTRYHEKQADRYALKNSSNPAAFIIAMRKLSETNLTDDEPHPLVEFLFHSHPAISKRIARAEAFIAANQ